MNVLKDVQSFFRSSPGEKRVIGRSLFGREIYAIKLGHGAPAGIVQYAMHGREFITSYLAFEHFRRGGVCGSVWFVPLANPDGAMLSAKGLVSAPKEKRAELLAFNGGNKDFSLWKANGRGVDLNVNFAAGWGTGKSNVFVPGSENYVGNATFSEPETQALKAFTEEVKPDYTVSFHTKGEEIYWRFRQKGMRAYRDYALAKSLSFSTGYPLGEAEGSAGGYKDWCVEKAGIPAFTVEAGREDAAHPLGAAELKDIVRKCKNAIADLSYSMKRATR